MGFVSDGYAVHALRRESGMYITYCGLQLGWDWFDAPAGLLARGTMPFCGACDQQLELERNAL